MITKKQRIIKWLNIFLLVINISAFVTLLLMNNKSAPAESTSNNYFTSDAFLKEELNLSNEQYKEIVKLDYKIFRGYQSLLDMQCEANFSLLAELLQDNPNKKKMDSIASRIGKYHASLKRQTIKHFMNLRNICTEDQSESLNQLIKDMMELDEQCKFCNKKQCARRESLKE